MDELEADLIATQAKVENGQVHLTLADGSAHTFPIRYYPRLQKASPAQLEEIQLRVGGRALRWESIDEDIWITDAILQRYPLQPESHVAEPPPPYGN